VTSPEWQQVRELFEAALDVDPGIRGEWLRAQTAPTSIRVEVASLLDYHSRAGKFLESPAPVADDAFEPGTRLGHYTIVREIGRGAMGRVYAAEDTKLGRTVALKALPPHLTGDASYRERLRREARAAAAPRHQNICTVYALEEADGQLFIVSELIDGRTLREEIDEGTLPDAASVAATARELAEALAAAHATGVTHRDFKPENVMRDHSGRLKVLDFGVATTADSQIPAASLATIPGVLVGTPAYMAPEQLNGGRADARTDVFAYGVVIYEYACGVHPFDAATPIGLVARVLESHAAPLARRSGHVPTDVANVVEQCLRKSADERFATAAAIVTALRSDGASTTATLNAATRGWWRIHQTALIAVYAGAAVLAWTIKEAFHDPLTLWSFIGIGVGAAIGGTMRGHLLFTSFINAAALRAEQGRVRVALRSIDILIAAALGAGGLWIAPARPLWGVLTVGFAAGIALAATLMEPATTAEAFAE
jgi:hypothetical protein